MEKLNPDLRKKGDPELGLIAPMQTTFYVKVNVQKSKMGDRVGVGVFADNDIVQGTIVCIGGGQIFSDLSVVPKDKDYAGIFDEHLFIAPMNYDNPDPNWLINHSCDSNLKLLGRLVLMASKNIRKDEELTVDYGTVAAGADSFFMKCCCGSQRCRKIITGNDWKDEKYYNSHYEEMPPYLQNKRL